MLPHRAELPEEARLSGSSVEKPPYQWLARFHEDDPLGLTMRDAWS
jgi:hypothetical protein